ncbi:MAG TPA: SAM-dependent methyltransferase, partial [Spirochaetia bacterium]|nr:SAM-dependent methyltransferase [Spirochaetia bacterium]
MDIGSEVFDLCMKPLEVAALDRRRRELIPQATGTILELGAGTGANLPYYDFTRVRELHLSDPELRTKLLKRA